MPSPVAHGLIGVLITRHPGFVKQGRLENTFRIYLFAFTIACLPDIDIAIGFVLEGSGSVYHGGLTHTFPFAFLAAACVTYFFLPKTKRAWGFVWIFLLLCSHVIMDALTGPVIGWHEAHPSKILWPFVDGWQMPVTIFRGIRHAQWFQVHNFITIGIELALCLPVVALSFFRKKFTRGKKH